MGALYLQPKSGCWLRRIESIWQVRLIVMLLRQLLKGLECCLQIRLPIEEILITPVRRLTPAHHLVRHPACCGDLLSKRLLGLHHRDLDLVVALDLCCLAPDRVDSIRLQTVLSVIVYRHNSMLF